MDAQILDWLKHNRLFSALDVAAREKLLPKLTEVLLKQGEILFLQGAISDSVYLLIDGRLGAEITTATGETKTVGHVDPGETVGELGALSKEPRSMTVRAFKDSILLRLSAKEFVDLCHQFPSIMYETVHPIISRSKNIIQLLSAEKVKKHVAIVPANKDISLQLLADKLATLTEDFNSILLISGYHADFSDPHDDVDKLKMKIRERAQHKKITRILYILKSYDTPLAKLALRKADTVYITADTRQSAKIDQHVLDKIQRRRLQLRTEPHLILIHPDDTLTPRNTHIWLSQTQFSLHHHVRLGVNKDMQRLTRFLRGKAVGLVLGGGGTRGWAHLGAIKALREIKTPIDIIGGTSVGALAAGCYAMNQSYDEAYEKFYRIVKESEHSVSWHSFTWPVISLFNADAFTKVQMEVFADTFIEDMWLPYFCISSNLATNDQNIHQQGLLWEKTRASSSIPGLIPPMLLNGELHLDGGLLNNLPVDVMRQFIGTKGKIVAVELNSYAPDTHKYNFPPILTLKDTFLAKVGKNHHHYRFPRFVDTFMRGVFLGSLLKARQNALTANIFVSLDLKKFKLLQSNIKQANRLIEIGYQETLAKCLHNK